MDTQKIVNELLASGLTHRELARLVPCASSTISMYASGDRGARTSFAIAQRLLVLHKSRCAKSKRVAA